MTERFDIIILGAGIAGASLAAALAGRARVLLLEREDFPGRHTTGRSAATTFEVIGDPPPRPPSFSAIPGPRFSRPRDFRRQRCRPPG